MTTGWPRPVFCIGALVGMAVAIPALAMEGHTMLAPEQIAWKPAPAALPQGAEAAVLYGDPAKEGPFALRVRFPQDYSVPPHTHPVDEVVTVISGTFHLGMGETADRDKAQPLPAGSFVAMAPGTAHYVFTSEATVIQINTVGPWGLTYINPADDPRQKSQ
jgi:quercetin dioxygenase-like cupin family protein